MKKILCLAIIQSFILSGYSQQPVLGSISGYVYDTTGLIVAKGKVFLFKEGSNLRDDFFAETQIQTNGFYQFQSIPYGNYYIVARADTTLYNYSLPTFYKNEINWYEASLVTISGVLRGIDIHIKYQNKENFSTVTATEPLEDIDITLEQIPAGLTAQQKKDTKTLGSKRTGIWKFIMFLFKKGK